MLLGARKDDLSGSSRKQRMPCTCWTCWSRFQAESWGSLQLEQVNNPGSGERKLAWDRRNCQDRSLWTLNIPDFTVLAPLSRTCGFLSAPSSFFILGMSSSTWPDPDTLGDPRDLCLTGSNSASSSDSSLCTFSLLHSSTLCWTNLVRSVRTYFFLQEPQVR